MGGGFGDVRNWSPPAPAAEILRGSLLKRTIRHKRGCPKCERGGGHLVWVLSMATRAAFTKQYCIRPEMKAAVGAVAEQLRELKAKAGSDL